MNFKKGDLVIHNREEARIIGKVITNYQGESSVRIEFLNTGATKLVSVTELSLLKYAHHSVRGKDPDNCKCGAWATSNPNLHSDWCPRYRAN